MDLYQKLRERRRELNLTMLEVAKKIGVSEATVSRWESGDIANMRRDKIILLANALKVHPSFIMGEDENYPQETQVPAPGVTEDYTTFPVIGEVAAGYDCIALEDWEGDTVDIPNSYLRGRATNEFFVLRVKGDSMYPTYQEGDKVLVLKQSTLNYSGQVGVILYDDDYASLKKVEYRMGENWLRMVPINPTHPTKKVKGEDLEHCRILGIPRLLIREIDD